MQKAYWRTYCFLGVLFGFGVLILLSSCNSGQKQRNDNSNNSLTAVTDSSATGVSVRTQLLTDRLDAPTAIAFPGNGDIWVTEQKGQLRVLKNGTLTDTPLLDLTSKMVKVNDSYEERGLLEVTLHPDFKSNRKFYVFYSAPSSLKTSDHKGVLAEYELPSGSRQINPNSGRVILTIEEPDGNHNGGCVQFGPDGYLYVGFGDGGGQGDKHGEIGNGQNMDTWLGKILRINVNTNSGYIVPKDNPFVGKPHVKPEIWANGFRNPYRFSFDKASGQLFAGDVGQDTWEEVDIIKKGANYGWRFLEGTHCYNPASGCDSNGITMPITEYSHKVGISVIGGYVYNGQQVPALKGKYVFADWVGKVFYLQQAGAAWKRDTLSLENVPENRRITAFGEDPAGELYILTNLDNGPGKLDGSIYKISKE